MPHEDYNPEASKKKRHNLHLPQSSNGSHQPSEKNRCSDITKKLEKQIVEKCHITYSLQSLVQKTNEGQIEFIGPGKSIYQ